MKPSLIKTGKLQKNRNKKFSIYWQQYMKVKDNAPLILKKKNYYPRNLYPDKPFLNWLR